MPAVFTEGVSWISVYLLFDSPLCSGQEFSTRAVQHKDWPMARECFLTSEEIVTLSIETGSFSDQESLRDIGISGEIVQSAPHPILKSLHDDWFEIFEHEVKWWNQHLSDPANRAALGIGDKEAFRPALDRARWALPGTIATGCAHTSNLRERARVIEAGASFSAGQPAAAAVWDGIRETYRQALPGLAGLGLREAVYNAEPGTSKLMPDHLSMLLNHCHLVEDGDMVTMSVTDFVPSGYPSRRAKKKSYADPAWNQKAQVDVGFRCSLAVARDWHRHRTLFPMSMFLCVDNIESPTGIVIDPHYEVKSDIGKQKLPALLKRSWEAYSDFSQAGQSYNAIMSLPLGTRVLLSGQGGLRDVIYLLELRAFAVGKNHEYQDQAEVALELLRHNLPEEVVSLLKL